MKTAEEEKTQNYKKNSCRSSIEMNISSLNKMRAENK